MCLSTPLECTVSDSTVRTQVKSNANSFALGFFNNYNQACVAEHNCQENMISIKNSTVDMYTVTTKAAVNMIVDDSLEGPVLAAPNRNVFGDTIAYYHSGS